MSECVVRMDMPSSCKKCKSTICLWVKDDDLDYMDIIEKVQDFRKKNDVGFPDFCPIICSLPEGHGRLGDLDALTRLMLERKQPLVGADSSKDRYRYMQWLADFNAIKDAKVIVPAEAERSE